ncbi:hypothetical protein GGI15_002947 [Coemansia interrupta]|uniref:Prolyl endopeptidase n=1 Tax=Coemansia interrupta TaxID=1126814 RepID=A0A9W8LIW5_9FUNG|nr:hypothetical protein GGI15_002947 [Coemansia interrupta]
MQKSGYELRNLLISDEHDHFACLAVKRSNANLEANASESSTVLVYSLDRNGQTKLVEKLTKVFNFVFGPKSSIFYTVLDNKLRAHQVVCHRIGQPQLQDTAIFSDPNDECFVDITRTKDKKFHIINSSTLDSSELRIFPSDTDFWCQGHPASNVAQNIRLMRARQKNVECFVDHHDSEFVILTNSPANDGSRSDIAEPLPFRLMRAPTDKPSSDNWVELLSVADDERIDDVEIFKTHIVVSIKRQGRPAVIVYNRSQGSRSELALPYGGNCAVRPEPSPQFDASSVRLSFSSPVHLESVVEYDLNTLKARNSWASTPLHIDADDYTVRQIKVPYKGVSVPMTLIHSRTAHVLNKASPTLVRVYGAYGVSLEPEFRVEDIPLLRRGWTVVLAHVRGGGELGREWYSSGRGLNKGNSVEDLLACTRFLLDRGISASDRLALTGVSAGGLVVGAALNAQPDYFRAATLHVPFVDPLSAMLDPQLPLTSVETAEWGNPLTNVRDYDSICQYAPYDNIRQNMVASNRRAPSILVTAGGQDKRVSAWQPAKWVARLRSRGGYATNDTGSNDGLYPKLLLSTSLDAGHFHSRHDGYDIDGGSNSYINAHALRNAFLISETGCDLC